MLRMEATSREMCSRPSLRSYTHSSFFIIRKRVSVVITANTPPHLQLSSSLRPPNQLSSNSQLRSDLLATPLLTRHVEPLQKHRRMSHSSLRACQNTPVPRTWRKSSSLGSVSPSSLSLRASPLPHTGGLPRRPFSSAPCNESRRIVAYAGGRDFESRRRRGWGGDESEEQVSGELQRMLVEQVRIQVGEMKVQQVVDESQKHLRKAVTDDMGQELDRIALRAMRGADEFSNRVLKQLDASAQALERDLNLARKEMEARERDFEKFQEKVHQSSNEGMFFKSISTPYSPSAPARGRARRTRITRMPPSSSSGVSPGRSGSVQPPSAVGGAVGPSASGRLREDEDGVEEEVFKKVLYFGLSLTCVSFMWSFASALLDGHLMSSSKVVEYAAVFAGFVVVKAGFEASAEEERKYANTEQPGKNSGEEGPQQKR